ncbi:Arginase/deacetylase [Lactarius hengduanensis]|nr:Arginase/deacetylase [Lactarius hengduanensis]
MKVFWDPICLLHDPPYEFLSGDKVPYFESPARLQVIKKELEEHPSLFQFELTDSSSGSIDIIGHVETVHGRGYLNYLRNAYDEWVRDVSLVTNLLPLQDAVLPDTFPHQKLVPGLSQSHVDSLSPVAKAGYYCFDLSSPITKGRRPPGHHAGTSLSGGYCFINNVTVAARFLQGFNQRPTDKPSVAILDVDYHHGNGTQEIFYSDPSVLYVSLHAEDDYPYFTGSTTEKGIDDGVGANINYPLPRGTQDSEYCAALSNAVEDIKKFDPRYLLLSLGVDTFVDDPISDFKLSPSCYTHIGQIVADLEKPTLFVMEGGYHMETIGKNVRAVLQGFEEQGRTDVRP